MVHSFGTNLHQMGLQWKCKELTSKELYIQRVC